MNTMNEFVKPTLVLGIICLVITALLKLHSLSFWKTNEKLRNWQEPKF